MGQHKNSINVIHRINRTKEKIHLVFSIDAKKALDKIQHFFIIKTVNKLEMEGKYLNTVKVTYENPIACIPI